MSTVTARCASLNKQLIALQEARELLLQADQYQARKTDIAVLAEEFERVARVADALVTAEVVQPRRLPPTTRLRESLSKIAARVRDEPQNLTQGRDFTTFRQRLERLTTDTEKVLDPAWRQAVAEHASLDQGFLQDLRSVPGQAQRVDRLQLQLRQVRQFGTTLPDSTEDVRVFRSHVSEMKSRLDELTADDYPPDVLEFFRSAQHEPGASYDLLTPEVAEWLRERGLLSRLRIRLVALRPEAGDG